MMIDPRVSFWLGVWTTILLMIGGGTVNLTHVVPDVWIPTINAWCVLLGTINSAVLTALHGYASPNSGPLTKDMTK